MKILKQFNFKSFSEGANDASNEPLISIKDMISMNYNELELKMFKIIGCENKFLQIKVTALNEEGLNSIMI